MRKISAFLLFFILGFVFVPFAKANLEKAVIYLQKQPPNDWITMAQVAAGEKSLPYDHLKTLSSGKATDYEKRILAITSLGFDPRDFFGQDFVGKLTAEYKNNQIGDENLLNDDFWGILALSSAGEDLNSEIIQKSKKFILVHQNQDGGFGYAIKTDSDTNDTAAAIAALLEVGLTKYSPQIKQAIKYLKNTQNNDGGFPFQEKSFSDGASTAWVVSALYKLGEISEIWQKQGKNPIDFLKSLQQSDGSFLWQTTSLKGSSLVTAYAVIALNEKFYPIKKISLKKVEKKKEETKKEIEKKKEVEKKEEITEPTKKPINKKIEKFKLKDQDSDSDELSDKKEKFYKTNPLMWDTDSDGFSDGREVAKGFDPKSPAPCPIKKFSKNSKKFAYSQPRLSPKKQERCYSRYLKSKLKKYFSKRIIGKEKSWSKMVYAFIYGNYSVLDIAKALKFGGKTVHSTLPRDIWQNSLDYQIYRNR